MPTLPATASPANIVVALNIAPNMDGVYWGILITTMLFGIIASQAWFYANNNQDGWYLRSFVAFLVLMDCAITGLTWQVLRFYLMINFGNPSVLLTVTTPWAVCITLVAIVATLTECFFATRIYLLNRNSLWAPILASVFALSGLACLSVAIHSNFVNPSVYQLTTKLEKMFVGIGHTLTLSTVMLVTAVLVTRLNSVRSGAKTTQSAIHKLLLFFVTRALFVTLNQLTFLVVFETDDPLNMHWAPFLLLDPKLHIITMMAMLNSRQSPPTAQTDSGAVMSFASNRHLEPISLGSFTKQPAAPGAGAKMDSDSTVDLALQSRRFIP